MTNQEIYPTYVKAMQLSNAAGLVAVMQSKMAILICMNVFIIIQKTTDMDVLSDVQALKTK